jgi:hypothetical protein
MTKLDLARVNEVFESQTQVRFSRLGLVDIKFGSCSFYQVANELIVAVNSE